MAQAVPDPSSVQSTRPGLISGPDIHRHPSERGVLSIGGEIDVMSAPPLRDALARFCDEHPGSTVVLDLANVGFLDSTGLGVLVGAARRMRGDGGDIWLSGGQPGLLRVLSITGLDRVFEHFDTLDAALEHRSSGR